jgi:uncharacterized protein YegP (UPF0339 family)
MFGKYRRGVVRACISANVEELCILETEGYMHMESVRSSVDIVVSNAFLIFNISPVLL